jgi:hypothetical protein
VEDQQSTPWILHKKQTPRFQGEKRAIIEKKSLWFKLQQQRLT